MQAVLHARSSVRQPWCSYCWFSEISSTQKLTVQRIFWRPRSLSSPASHTLRMTVTHSKTRTRVSQNKRCSMVIGATTASMILTTTSSHSLNGLSTMKYQTAASTHKESTRWILTCMVRSTSYPLNASSKTAFRRHLSRCPSLPSSARRTTSMSPQLWWKTT